MQIEKIPHGLLESVVSRGLARRDFLKICATTAATFGLSQMEVVRNVAEAVGGAKTKPPVIWLEGQDCAGCSISFTGNLNPPALDIILDSISLRYHETVMVASGYQSEDAYHHTVEQGGYVLVVGWGATSRTS